MISREEFYERYINHWMRSDINSMRDHGNNFPLALCTLSYIEFLGSILTGNGAKGEGKNNTKTYLENCFDNKHYLDKIEILWDVFRNGLAHDYFPRGAVSKVGPGPMININGKMVLNIMDFSQEFLASLDKFKAVLDKEESTANFDKRINEITTKTSELEADHLHKLNIRPWVAGATGSAFVSPGPISGLAQVTSMFTAGVVIKKDVYTPPATSDLSNGVILEGKEDNQN